MHACITREIRLSDVAATKDELRYDVEIAARIREAFVRAYGDLKEGDAGRATGTNQSRVNRYKNGVSQIPLKVLLVLAEKLSVGLDEIVRPSWISSDLLVRIREQSIAIEALKKRVDDAERALAEALKRSGKRSDLDHRAGAPAFADIVESKKKSSVKGKKKSHVP